MARTSDAVAFVGGTRIQQRVPRAGSSEGREVQELRGILGVLKRPNDIGPVKSFACSGIVAFEFIVQVPGLSILQIEHTVEAPAVLQLRQRSTHLGELVSEVPREAAADIETGVPAITR